MQNLIVAAAIITNEKDEILICRRSETSKNANLWEFPGGKLEKNETLEECVVRECKEELDLDIELHGIFDTASFTYPDSHIDFTFFNAKILRGQVIRRVHRDIKWVKRENLKNFDFCPADVDLVDKLAQTEKFKDPLLEKMDDFFAARVHMYDAHMLEDVEGCKEGYEELARLLPETCGSLLDLGCGTGLELAEIFKRFPKIFVTGVDMTKEMLNALKEKFNDKSLTLIHGDYFTCDFGGIYDCAVSFQTMHHFKKQDKLALYKKINEALTPDGTYIECDYMVESQKEEDFYFSEYDRIAKEQSLSNDTYYHYDTPCTIENQIDLLKNAGFASVQEAWRCENTTMLVAKKQS